MLNLHRRCAVRRVIRQQCLSFHSSTSLLASRRCVGILREAKNKWERRAALAPTQVAELVDRGVQVLVQPSERRIFADNEYSAAGAIITEDVSAANVIFGVKEVPIDKLIPNKTYVMFSHTIKAQPDNMPLLDACVEKNIRLVDYECIRAPKSDGGKRLVAFGRFAGVVGMIDMLRGVGERLLSLGYSTPFMGLSSAHSYPSMEAAKAAVTAVGNELDRVGLSNSIGPLPFVFTGKGNAFKGAAEVFELLPHQLMDEPVKLAAAVRQGNRSTQRTHSLLGCYLSTSDLVEPIDPAKTTFSRELYYANPGLFKPAFHKNIAPYTGVLVNNMYWDRRYPRLLTIEQAAQLESEVKMGLLGVADISCDIDGSVEFTTHATTIERPFYLYNHDLRQESLNLDDPGKENTLMMSVDNLPAEFPREASQHFSDALLPFVEALSRPPQDVALTELPEQIRHAVITDAGALTSEFEYINNLRATQRSVESRGSHHHHGGDDDAKVTWLENSLLIQGHLFDSAFINKALDLVEHSKCTLRMVEWSLGVTRDEVSSAVFTLSVPSSVGDAKVQTTTMKSMMAKLVDLGKMLPTAQVKITALPYVASPASSSSSSSLLQQQQQTAASEVVVVVREPNRRILVLGSGFVVKPVVDYLTAQRGRKHDATHNFVTVASNTPEQARTVVGQLPNATSVYLDASHVEGVSELVREHDVVVSLLPATMHVSIAEQCIKHGKHLVTASYTSDAMRALDGAAKTAGISIVNEVGLDPGIDHMSAMSIIDEVHANGDIVTGFQSVCGGLPAPEAADNPLGYKFSWSPLGVLTAAQNPATYLLHGKQVEVAGNDLLANARPIHINTAFNLQQLPNRNSLAYIDTYNLRSPHLQTMYRGTLRYGGFCEIMNCFARLGMLKDEANIINVSNWADLMWQLTGSSPTQASSLAEALYLRLQTDDIPLHEVEMAVSCAQWLGMLNPDTPVKGKTAVRALCSLLEQRLVYGPRERDMVLLHHHFDIRSQQHDRLETRTSTMVVYGDDSYSAMARTVGFPTAITTQMILDGRYRQPGVAIPTIPDLYSPLLKDLQQPQVGVHFKETHNVLANKKQQ